MQKHISLKVAGRVQGVHYRVSARAEAERLGIKGFVRNEPDGSVYIEAEADEGLLANLITWCKEGPPLAQVDDVEINDGTWKGFSEFVVKR